MFFQLTSLIYTTNCVIPNIKYGNYILFDTLRSNNWSKLYLRGHFVFVRELVHPSTLLFVLCTLSTIAGIALQRQIAPRHVLLSISAYCGLGRKSCNRNEFRNLGINPFACQNSVPFYFRVLEESFSKTLAG